MIDPKVFSIFFLSENSPLKNGITLKSKTQVTMINIFMATLDRFGIMEKVYFSLRQSCGIFLGSLFKNLNVAFHRIIQEKCI